jgi:glyoxylase-like metal-dependent hydrolase (beta-lactamase superfamily II)
MVLHELGEGRLLIDLDFQDTPDVIGSYLIPEKEGWAVVETGPTTVHKAFMEGLAEAGIAPVEVKDVFVTHIHLDHAGGSGALAESLPNATFHVHKIGLPHMVDPTRLIASSKKAWGDELARSLWGEVVPLPAARVHGLEGGERFPMDRGSFLEVLTTPGHASHHVSFYDSALKGIMVGDAAGVLLPGATHNRPGLPPPDLDIEAYFRSLETLRGWTPEKLMFSHFGPFDRAMERLTEAAESAQWWVDVALETARREPTVEAITKAIAEADEKRSLKEGERYAILSKKHELVSGCKMAAQGLLRYFTKKGLVQPK